MKKSVQCGFGTYYKALMNSEKRHYPQAVGSEWAVILIVIALTLLSYTTKIDTDGMVKVNVITLVYLFVSAIWAAAIVSGGAMRQKETLLSVTPVINTRRPLFNALGIWVSAVIAFVSIVLAFVCIPLLPLLFVQLVFRAWQPVREYFLLLGELSVQIGAYGIVYLIIYVIYNFGAAFTYANIQSKKKRIIFVGAFAAATEGFFLLINNLSAKAGKFVFTSLSVQNFQNLPLPFLWLILMAAAAAALIAYGIILSVRHCKVSEI